MEMEILRLIDLGIENRILTEPQTKYFFNSPIKSEKSTPNGSTTSSKKVATAPAHIMHPAEVIQIKEALLHLLSDPNKKSVIIDIIDRNPDGSIFRDAGFIGRHAIVLYKQIVGDQTQILVIDPNNTNFSSHLGANAQILLMGLPPADLIVDDKLLQQKIYVSPQNAKHGQEPDCHRDCVDMAVKLALALNECKEVINIANLMDIREISALSNQDDLSSLFTESSVQSNKQQISGRERRQMRL
jgi:hypothetical protein